jgi:hypothetical protein
VGDCLCRRVSKSLEEHEGALQVLVRLVEVAHLDAGVGQMPQGTALGFHVSEPLRRGQRNDLGGLERLPTALEVEIGDERPRQPPCVFVESAGGGQVDGSKQRGVLLAEPRQGRGMALHHLEHGALAGRRQVDRIPVRLQLPVGVDCHEEVVVEEAVDGRVPVRLGLLTLGELPSMGVQQVVQGVDARSDLGGEAGIVELDEDAPGFLQAPVGHRGGRGLCGLGSRMQPEHPEHRLSLRRERRIRPGEHIAQVGRLVLARRHRVERRDPAL